MLQNLTNFFSLIANRKIKKQLKNTDLIAVGTRDTTWIGNYQPTAISFEDLTNQLSGNTDVNLGPVLNNLITTPPIDPENGDRYIVPVGSTGDWAGQTNNITEWDEETQTWGFYIPLVGDRTIVTTGINAGKVYEFNGATWVEQALPTTSTTPFYLGGTTVDAGGNKISAIYREGNVRIGSTSIAPTNYKLRVVGESLLDLISTRLNFSGTNVTSRTNNWYKILRYRFGSNTFISDTFKLFMTDSGNSNGSGTQVEFNVTIKKQNTSIFCSVLIDQKSKIFGSIESNFEVLYNNTTKELNFYYKPTQNYSSSSWAVLANRNNGNIEAFAWDNLYLNTATLSGETSDSATIDKQMVSYSIIGASSVTTTHSGTVVCGDQAALTTTATNGFLYIPTCPGIPTGVPTAITGKVPLVFDSTNGNLYIHSGGSWSIV